MKRWEKIVLLMLFTALLSSCVAPPEYPIMNGFYLYCCDPSPSVYCAYTADNTRCHIDEAVINLYFGTAYLDDESIDYLHYVEVQVETDSGEVLYSKRIEDFFSPEYQVDLIHVRRVFNREYKYSEIEYTYSERYEIGD